MEKSARLIARKILAVHLLLLLAVLTIVFFASRTIYYAARQDQIQLAVASQEHLAGQASRSIRDYYSTIINDLDLARRTDVESPATQPAAPIRPRGVMAREGAYYPFLWNQLEGRITALFIYDRRAKDAETGLQFMEPRNVSVAMVEETRTLANSAQGFLTTTTRPSISRLLQVGPKSLLRGDAPAGGVNLISVPLYEGRRFELVAVVPAAEVQSRLLPDSSEPKRISTTFLDENLQVIASTSPAMFGLNLKDIDDPTVRDVMTDFASNPLRRTEPFEQHMTIAGAPLEPRLITVEPVIIAGQRWPLLITSPMSDVDAVVRDLFRTALYWAAFIIVSITAILISTARWMIRGRLRLERIQHELLEKEISQARQIQLNWLPTRHSAGSALDIAAINHPANHISGDFYNWFALPDGRHAITIGDVTGHGMAAAFLMATTQLLVRTTMPRITDPGLCLEEVNRHLCTQAFRGQFVTMLIIVLDLEHGTAQIATAGHHPPLVSHGGSFTPLPLKSQLVLAVDDNQHYATECFDLTPKSSILLFTDGVVEAQNTAGDRYDPERLQTSLTDKFGNAQSMVDAVVASVNTFRGNRDLDDDLTLVAIQIQPSIPPTEDPATGDPRSAAVLI